MIRIADALIAQIKVDTACITKLGGRIYKDLIPSEVANPCASYTTISDLPKNGIWTHRVASVQMIIYGDTGESVSSAADSVISAIVSDKYNPTLKVWSAGSDAHSVILCLLTSCIPGKDEETNAEMVLLQFEIHYTLGGT